MIQLLLCSEGFTEGASDQTRFGGVPSAGPGDFPWPICREGGGNMQFLGQIRPRNPASGDLLLLFICQNDDQCSEWEADAGSNAVIAVPVGDLAPVQPPAAGVVVRNTRYGAAVAAVAATGYEEARAAWRSETGLAPRRILGQLAGEPEWLQGDETPTCDACHKPMQLVAQLEEGPEADTAMNFGGGCADVFQCTCDGARAKLLWQC